MPSWVIAASFLVPRSIKESRNSLVAASSLNGGHRPSSMALLWLDSSSVQPGCLVLSEMMAVVPPHMHKQAAHSNVIGRLGVSRYLHMHVSTLMLPDCRISLRGGSRSAAVADVIAHDRWPWHDPRAQACYMYCACAARMRHDAHRDDKILTEPNVLMAAAFRTHFCRQRTSHACEARPCTTERTTSFHFERKSIGTRVFATRQCCQRDPLRFA